MEERYSPYGDGGKYRYHRGQHRGCSSIGIHECKESNEIANLALSKEILLYAVHEGPVDTFLERNVDKLAE